MQFSTRALDYQDSRLNPPDEAVECPWCKAREVGDAFVESIRDAIVQHVGEADADEMLNPNNVYYDGVLQMRDWIEDTIRVRVEKEGGKDCANCARTFGY